jgi:hypothetical protein
MRERKKEEGDSRKKRRRGWESGPGDGRTAYATTPNSFHHANKLDSLRAQLGERQMEDQSS